MGEKDKDLVSSIERFQLEAQLVSNRQQRSVQLDMLIRVEDLVRRALAFSGFRRRVFVLSDLYFDPKHGFWWGASRGRPATAAEVLDVLPFEQIVQALTHFFETNNLRKKGK